MQKQIMDAQNGTSSSKAPIDVHAAVRLALARLSETPTSWCVASFD
jgi:hypothetical protein